MHEQPMGEPTLLDPALVAALYVEHDAELRRFVMGVVRDHEAANDILQATFTKAMECGHQARIETLKGWLFKVAFNEALVWRRRRAIQERAFRRLASVAPTPSDSPAELLTRGETVERIRAALKELPEEQRRVVQARIYEEKPFAQIAKETNVALGTVLTRMRLALEKLRCRLRTEDDNHGEST